MNIIQKTIAWFRIPWGYYCYRGKRVCPYWYKFEDDPEQESGYCLYLRKSDWDINDEKRDIEFWKGDKHWIEYNKSPHDLGMTNSLLWDQCKECNIKKYYPWEIIWYKILRRIMWIKKQKSYSNKKM